MPDLRSVPVAVMNIRKMRVAMRNGQVLVCVTVRFAWGYTLCMFMPVVFIVRVAMGVLLRYMPVTVFMLLGQVQPYPEQHECRGQPEQQRD